MMPMPGLSRNGLKLLQNLRLVQSEVILSLIVPTFEMPLAEDRHVRANTARVDHTCLQ